MRQISKIINVKLYALIIFLSLFYGLAFTFSDFYNSPFDNAKDFFILSLQWGVVVTATFGFLYLIIINKYIFAIVFPLLTICCGILTYMRYALQISLTPMLLDLAFVNDAGTWLENFNLLILILIIASLLFSAVCVYYRWKYITVKQPFIHAAIAISIILVTNHGILRRPLSQRIPYVIYYSLKEYINSKNIVQDTRNTFVANDASTQTDSLTVVLVLGESLRADHLQLNGYHRNTTPLLAKDSNVISFPNIYTNPYYTHTSIPHLLTRADSISPDRAYTEESFISLFKQAGYKTYWIANQESVSTYVYFMNECDTLIYVNGGKSLYIFDKWLDSDLLPDYKESLNDPSSKKLLILHTIGSHWWYNSHYPDSFETFKPTIKSRIVKSNTQEEMINSYDNTILYTDFVIHRFIDELREQNAILFFISDHGESLGENGYYLHGEDRPELHYPACFIWYSTAYENMFPQHIQSLKKNRNNRYLTDFLFHTILDAADIETQYKDKRLSIINTQ